MQVDSSKASRLDLLFADPAFLRLLDEHAALFRPRLAVPDSHLGLRDARRLPGFAGRVCADSKVRSACRGLDDRSRNAVVVSAEPRSGDPLQKIHAPPKASYELMPYSGTAGRGVSLQRVFDNIRGG